AGVEARCDRQAILTRAISRENEAVDERRALYSALSKRKRRQRLPVQLGVRRPSEDWMKTTFGDVRMRVATFVVLTFIPFAEDRAKENSRWIRATSILGSVLGSLIVPVHASAAAIMDSAEASHEVVIKNVSANDGSVAGTVVNNSSKTFRNVVLL